MFKLVIGNVAKQKQNKESCLKMTYNIKINNNNNPISIIILKEYNALVGSIVAYCKDQGSTKS